MTYSATQLQLTQVLQQLYRRLGGKVTLATNGSTTTVVDTKLADELADSNEDDIFNGGTVIVLEDTAGAAPEGEFSRVTDYVASTTTLTFSPALTAAPGSGDRVIIAPPDFPLYDMIEVTNDSLKYLTRVPRYDTSITTAANQTEYTLPVALKGRQLLGIEIQGILTDANDNRWQPLPRARWRIGYAAAGSTGTLILPQLASGYTVRVAYMAEHARVDAYDDPIDEHLDRNLVHACIFAHALQWKNDRDALSGGADQSTLALEQKAWSLLDREIVRNRPQLMPQNLAGAPHWGSEPAGDEFYPIPLP